jgi:hypothetical protein
VLTWAGFGTVVSVLLIPLLSTEKRLEEHNFKTVAEGLDMELAGRVCA